MPIFLLDQSLKVTIFFEENDSIFEDDVCLSIIEECPEDEKLFKADETNIYVTPDEACQLANALLQAAAKSQKFAQTDCAKQAVGNERAEE